MSEMSNSQVTVLTAAATNKAKVSSGDTVANYLAIKLLAGTGITVTKNNAGANETLTIASTGSDAYLGKVTVADTTPGYLQSKIFAGTGIVVTKQNAGANESIKLDIPWNSADIIAGEAITTYRIVRYESGVGLRAAIADSIANATSVLGVLTASVDSGNMGNIICAGYAIMDVESTITTSANVYLSRLTAGKGTFLAPTSGQVLYGIGHAVKLIGGTQYWVQLCLDREPLTV